MKIYGPVMRFAFDMFDNAFPRLTRSVDEFSSPHFFSNVVKHKNTLTRRFLVVRLD